MKLNLQRIPEAGEGTSFAATQTERDDPIDRLLAESRRLAQRSHELTNRTQVLFLLAREKSFDPESDKLFLQIHIIHGVLRCKCA